MDANLLDKKKLINERKAVFEKCEHHILKGYYVYVKDNWMPKVHRRHITENEKELYIKEFGDKMVDDDVFFDWWCKVNKVAKYAENKTT